jgi:rubredoxin
VVLATQQKALKMSFRCELCNKAQETGTNVQFVTVERRPQFYTNQLKYEDDNGKIRTREVNSEGWEIVKEKKACPECATAQQEETTD